VCVEPYTFCWRLFALGKSDVVRLAHTRVDLGGVYIPFLCVCLRAIIFYTHVGSLGRKSGKSLGPKRDLKPGKSTRSRLSIFPSNKDKERPFSARRRSNTATGSRVCTLSARPPLDDTSSDASSCLSGSQVCVLLSLFLSLFLSFSLSLSLSRTLELSNSRTLSRTLLLYCLCSPA
jgi:hypothetical protein